ncbi:MAG: GNAT family N-acetyltransferase [Oscillospiraceae bacterium]|nr:GNAT family N-acetyltransferase [Oscillospiraceae bacterium]
MRIQTPRLVLRPLEISDLVSTHEYASDTTITQYMVHLPNDNIQETESYLNKVATEWKAEVPRFFEFAITLNNKHIGAVSFHYKDDERHEGELGWMINKSYQGNGYATEAAKAVLNFAFNECKVRKVIATCDYRNGASVKVMKKIGLSLERDDEVRRYKGSNEDIKGLMFSLSL